jgi:hypothetical protein
MFRGRWRPTLALLLAGACFQGRPANLDTLVLQDSTYLAPGTREPFTGRVVRYFPGDSGRVQIEGTLRDGTWEGELTVYHRSGRIRYQGRLAGGAPCGAWTENREDAEAGNLYLLLKQDIESMGIYPPCPGR